MKIWVINQSKDILIMPKDIEIHNKTKTDIICNYKNGNNYFVLGMYKSNERAKEVMEEIQEHIDNKYSYVFEMPEE